MREIVVDTETTGLDPRAGHRIVEIACLELSHHVPTGRRFHSYFNPEREVPQDATAIHGLGQEFLASHPRFGEIAEALLAFLGADPLVIHNAEFDLAFLNAELERAGRGPVRSPLVDTLALARRRFPGAPASLDALCRRFAIDLSGREKHGAEIDCALLAAVYLELLGGRQPGLDLGPSAGSLLKTSPTARPPRAHAPSAEELALHRAMLASVREPIWLEEE
jgi:DNA polymerase III subunit epsilon